MEKMDEDGWKWMRYLLRGLLEKEESHRGNDGGREGVVWGK